jgi:hypothetical protein
MDPGSAAHRFALRSVRGTTDIFLRSGHWPRREGRCELEKRQTGAGHSIIDRVLVAAS